MRIDLHIGRLVIDGPVRDGDAIRAALTRELALRLADAPPALFGQAVASVRAHAPATATQSADALGGGVAQALHAVLVPPAGAAR